MISDPTGLPVRGSRMVHWHDDDDDDDDHHHYDDDHYDDDHDDDHDVPPDRPASARVKEGPLGLSLASLHHLARVQHLGIEINDNRL